MSVITLDGREPKIKIYVSCHKESYIPENSLLYPIQVGTALADKEIPGILHDNTGDNISEKNKRYCELTAQYWAWKNDDEADYYGFMHYRRYFSFNPVHFQEDDWGEIPIPYLTEDAVKKLRLDEKAIQKIVEGYDIIVPVGRELSDKDRVNTVYQQYAESDFQFSRDFDIMIDIIEDIYPEYHKAISDYINSTKCYECNMFIMKKKYFKEYSQWLFTILKALDEKIDYSGYSVESTRAVAFLGERLLGIWYTHLKENSNCKFLELQRTLFRSC